MSKDKIHPEYNEAFNYQSTIFKIMNIMVDTFISGKDGSMELDVLGVFIPDALRKDFEKEKAQINEQHAKDHQALLDSWRELRGHPTNQNYPVIWTQARAEQAKQLRTLANQQILHSIINMMYEKGFLLTDASNMSSSLV